MKKLLSILVLLTGVLLLGGCGGGSSSDDGDGAEIIYSGSTEQAVISEENGQELVASSMSAGVTSAAVSTSVTASVDNASDQGRITLQALNPLIALVTDLQTVDISGEDYEAVSAALHSHTRTVEGDCGGTRTVTLSYDDDGIFTAAVEYDSYCNNAVTIVGDAEFSGTLNIETEQYVNYVAEFDDLSLSTDTIAYSIDGSIDTDVSTSGLDMLMTLNVLDETENRVYRIEDYSYSITFTDSAYNYAISGRFYHPDYGYVSLETTEIFYVNNDEDYPYAGQIVVTGASSTAVSLTALSSSECQVDIDVNGDGTYDISTGPIPWTAL